MIPFEISYARIVTDGKVDHKAGVKTKNDQWIIKNMECSVKVTASYGAAVSGRPAFFLIGEATEITYFPETDKLIIQ